MGKHPIDHERNGESQAAREYARVEREQANPMSDPKVKAMTKSAETEEGADRAKKYARVEREQADPITDPKVRAMNKGGHSDEDKSLATRIKKFLKIDRQRSDS